MRVEALLKIKKYMEGDVNLCDCRKCEFRGESPSPYGSPFIKRCEEMDLVGTINDVRILIKEELTKDDYNQEQIKMIANGCEYDCYHCKHKTDWGTCRTKLRIKAEIKKERLDISIKDYAKMQAGL